MRKALLFALAALVAFALPAEVEFRGLDLGEDGILLFSAGVGLPGGGSYEGLFAADPVSREIRSQSFYPEEMSLVDGGRRLQVRNRFGLFRSGPDFQGLSALPGFPNFERGAAIVSGRLPPCAASPNGAFVLAAEPVSPAFSRLVLFDAVSGAVALAAEGVEYSIEELPARWSPDSNYFVYAKGGSLYYYSLEQLRSGRVLDEASRRIGDGRIGAARWASDGSLFYLRASSLYRILPAEFFTQALYRGLAGMGVLAGKTPFPYDPNFDDFWVSADGQRIILSKGGRSLFLVYLDPDDFGSKARVTALPHLFLQGGTRVKSVLWPARGPVTVFTGSLHGGGASTEAYRFTAPADPAELDLAPRVTELEAKGVSEIVLSPGETEVALVMDKGLVVRDYESWAVKSQIPVPGALHVLWRDEGRVVIGGKDLIESVELSTGRRSLVALAQAPSYGRAADSSLLAKVDGIAYSKKPPAFGPAASPLPAAWQRAEDFLPRDAATSSADYRVYLDSLSSGSYRNTLMIRSVKDLGTRPLFPVPLARYAPFPEKDEPREGGIFDHGSRIRRREVALVFNALDSAEGLVKVLSVLADYGISSSFFVNGEFVRREPGAARLLSESGHEIGSMFFTAVDPTDARFRADRDYIRRGLARAEDEWYQATGTELSLIWHTPYYSASSDILEAGDSMNYVYIGRDIDPLDWVGRKDAASFPGSYLPAHAIVESVLGRVRPGSIIPLRLGTPEGGRDDYLFNELALLVDALQTAGYAIVPVSTLIDHAE